MCFYADVKKTWRNQKKKRKGFFSHPHHIHGILFFYLTFFLLVGWLVPNSFLGWFFFLLLLKQKKKVFFHCFCFSKFWHTESCIFILCILVIFAFICFISVMKKCEPKKKKGLYIVKEYYLLLYNDNNNNNNNLNDKFSISCSLFIFSFCIFYFNHHIHIQNKSMISKKYNDYDDDDDICIKFFSKRIGSDVCNFHQGIFCRHTFFSYTHLFSFKLFYI